MTTPSIRINHKLAAWSLIELIGVLAVIAILAAVLVPALIRHLDKVAGDQETAALKSYAEALQQSIVRSRYIPCHTNWAQIVASELGASVGDVSANPRRNPRIFLIDPNLQVGTNNGKLPYRQDNFGSVIVSNGAPIPPVNPRIMILSTIGRALPAAFVPGIPTTNDFNALWDWNDAGTLLPASSAWATWPGHAEDIKVCRVNLSSLFLRLLLTTYSSSGNGLYSIDWLGTNSVIGATGVDGWFLQNSILGLHTHTGILDSQQVLRQDSAFVYDQNVWRAAIAGVSPVGGLDIGNMVDKFLSAPANNRAPLGQQALVVERMMKYMNCYEAWADAGFPSQNNNSILEAAKSAQSDMMQAVRDLYQANDHDPYEQPCPP